jgi:hypothetical protein
MEISRPKQPTDRLTDRPPNQPREQQIYSQQLIKEKTNQLNNQATD